MSKNKIRKSPEITPITPETSPSGLGFHDTLNFDELNRGIVRIDGSIGEGVSAELFQKIDYLVSRGYKRIVFYINSSGGEIHESFAIYDRLINLARIKVSIEAIAEGRVSSAAAMIILQAFPTRMSLPNARFSLHEPSSMSLTHRGTSEVKDESKEMAIVTDITYRILSKRCKKTQKEISEFIGRKEIWLSAQEAKDFGLIDDIVKKMSWSKNGR